MASSFEKTALAHAKINQVNSISGIAETLRNKSVENEKSDRLPVELGISKESTDARRLFLKDQTKCSFGFLEGEKPFEDLSSLEGNIENFIGMSMVPTGVIGPLRVIGTSANGDYFIPLATSEGALVASYHRGAKACSMAGGVSSICLVESVQRSPLFKFLDISELGLFLTWVLQQQEEFRAIVGQTSRFAQLLDMRANVEGNHLILVFEFHTGDAAGQNMVTLCTDAICKFIVEHAPIKPQFWFVEGNYSGDKKATALSFTNVRGKKVTAEIELSPEIVSNVLKTTPEMMSEYWKSSTIGVIQSGAIGAQGHYANGLTALFIATGQDAACIAEAAVGITRMEVTSKGNLYCSVTLPNLIVGTVGGGTSLPTQKECLELMGCYGQGNARRFAEICAAVALSGELSIAAALSAGHFSSAHKKFGRRK